VINSEQFADYLRPAYRLADLPEKEDARLGGEAAFGRRPTDIAPSPSAYLARHPYEAERGSVGGVRS
jgi:hypothetical protein